MSDETNKFADRSARTVIAGSSATVRNLHRDSLKQLGFNNVVSVADIKGVLEILEMELIDWVICPLSIDEKIDALSLLNLCLITPRLQQTKITIIIKEENQNVIKPGFNYGMFSYMIEKSTKNEIEEQYQMLNETLKFFNHNLTKVSAQYLRQLLTDDHAQLLKFEQNLMLVFPGDAQILTFLARAQFANGLTQSAKRTLEQAKAINEDLANDCKKIEDEFANVQAESNEEVLAQNLLGLREVVLIDHDTHSLAELEGYLKDIGVESIKTFPDPKKAIDHLKDSSEVDLIITEWALKKVAGAVLIQKIKSITHLISVPIIAINEKIEDKDLPIIQEIGAMSFIKKPTERQEFLTKVIWTIQQQRLPTETGVIEFNIRQFILNNQIDKAKSLYGKLLKSEKISESKKLKIQAEFAFADHKYDLAKNNCMEIIRLGETSVFVLSLLGKSLMKLREYTQALQCLDLADSMSPMNIDRICEISDCHTANDNFEKATDTLQDAINLDDDNDRIKQSQAKLSLAQGDTNAAKELLSKVKGLQEVIAFMNNRAVSLALCNRTDEGIELYKKAIDSLPENREDLLIVIYYNLALAFARNEKRKDSLEVLKQALKYKASRNNSKIKSLYIRLKKSLEGGPAFQLKTSNHSETTIESEYANEDEFINLISLKPGEICLHRIYVLKGIPKDLESKFKTAIQFNPRKIIKKDQQLSA